MTKPTKMLAFHSDPKLKEFYLARVRDHRKADELIHGTYWQGGKGCAVGCTIHSGQHSNYETELGIPQALARIEDGIFEGLTNGESNLWPEKFLSAIHVGADLLGVKDKFLFWLLVDETDGVIRFAKSERSRKAIREVAGFYADKIAGKAVTDNQWRAAAYTAYTAAYTAAAYTADAAAAAAAAAADAAAADAAAAAAAAADDAADDADDDAADDADARASARKRQAEKLIELLEAATP